MGIVASCSPDAEGNWPEGAWINIEPRYNDPVEYRERAFSYTNAQGELVTGTTKDAVIIGYKPEVSANHVLNVTHKGLVLSKGENNGYDDSDFYAIVWDPETQTTQRIIYASTRGWTYDLSATVDATPEVVAAYEAKVAYERRKSGICRRRDASKMRAEFARKFGVRPSAIRRLEQAYGPINPTQIAYAPSRYNNHYRSLAISMGFSREAQKIDKVLQLATSFVDGKLRSAFKKKLAEQVVNWLRDPAPQYPTPLSRKQVEYV